ncbi:hypothetical protein J6590_079861 [Homalodisca vitripennis]|nr:hypothetical protein J6590_079861 [Homalodisca vitripennis]
MMSSTPASAPMRMDNGTTLPSPPVSMQQYDTYSNALKTTCNSSHAAATEPSAISTASDVSEKNFENQRTSHLQSFSTQCGCSKTRKFRDSEASFNLGWLVNSPTRVFGGSQTAIDNFVTDIPGTFVSVVATAISDHDAQLIKISQQVKKTQDVTVYRRDTRPSNINLLNKGLNRELVKVGNVRLFK